MNNRFLLLSQAGQQDSAAAVQPDPGRLCGCVVPPVRQSLLRLLQRQQDQLRERGRQVHHPVQGDHHSASYQEGLGQQEDGRSGRPVRKRAQILTFKNFFT